MTFTSTPERPETLARLPAHQTPKPNLTGAHPGSIPVVRPGATIMIVEDDPHVREFTRSVLRSFGYQVVTADSESQALWVWDRNRKHIDLLLTDIMIPNCTTGTQLARKFTQEKPQLRVLYTSGFGREIGEDDTQFMRRPEFLQKPYTVRSLMEMVAHCLASEPEAGV